MFERQKQSENISSFESVLILLLIMVEHDSYDLSQEHIYMGSFFMVKLARDRKHDRFPPNGGVS